MHHNKDLVEKAYAEGTKSKDAFAMRLPVVDEGTEVPAEVGSPSLFTEEKSEEPTEEVAQTSVETTKLDIAKQQGFTGSICTGCGSTKMKRNGSCEICLDCGATSGCS